MSDIPVTGEDNSSKTIILGKIAGVYGVKGWVKVISFTRPMENIFQYPEWQLLAGTNKQTLVVENGKQHGKGLIVKFAGLDDREEAKKLFGKEVAVFKDELPKLPEGEYYWHDLIGLTVSNEDDIEFGVVKKIHETGANDVLEIKGKGRYLIPLIYDVFVTEVDLASQQMQVKWDSDEQA